MNRSTRLIRMSPWLLGAAAVALAIPSIGAQTPAEIQPGG